MRAIRCLVAALLAAGLVTFATAQPQPGIPGFGGTDLTTLVLNNKDLQEELKVTDEQ